MKCQSLNFVLFLGFLTFVSGCNRYGPWLTKHFKEAKECSDCELLDAQAAIRRMPVYQPNAWKTVDIIYALPMNSLIERVRERLNCCCVAVANRGAKKAEQKRIERGLTRFYVMTDGYKEAWCFVLSVCGGGAYKPAWIRSRELDRGMRGILVDQLAFKKNIFEIAFETVVTDQACDLIASNGSYTVTLSWDHFDACPETGLDGFSAAERRMDPFF